MIDIKNIWSKEHVARLDLARKSKNPMLAFSAMCEMYESLTKTEREEINLLLKEWIVSPNPDERFTALALVESYSIKEAIPAMKDRIEMLKNCKIPEDPQGYNEREKILKKLKKLQ